MDTKFNYDTSWVNTETGEVLNIQSGSKIVSPDRVQQQKEYAIAANQTYIEKNEQYSATQKMRGNFFAAPCQEMGLFWSNISEPTLGKLIYLATYIDKNNCICHDGNWTKENNVATRSPIPMTKAEIQQTLNVSRQTFTAFWKECEVNNIIIESEGVYYLSKKMFRFCDNSNINKRKTPMVKMFKHAIRYMYDHTDERSKKTLVYLYRLIPFINLNYNGLCTNPFERDKSKIKALPLSEICDMFGIDRSHQTRFLKKLKKLRFIDKEGIETSVIRYTWLYYDEDIYWITINPQFYSGYISETEMVSMVEEFRLDEQNTKYIEGSDNYD